VLAWEESRVGDPADDFAELARSARPDTLDAVLEAYAGSRIERPDAHLVQRARLAAEMAPLRTLLHGLASSQLDVVERTAEQLRALDGRVEADDRRHAAQDASRSERTRWAHAGGATAIEPDDPERAEPAWDATQPHVPFPMLGQTQAMSTGSHAAGQDAGERGDAGAPSEQGYAVPSGQSTEAPTAQTTAQTTEQTDEQAEPSEELEERAQSTVGRASGSTALTDLPAAGIEPRRHGATAVTQAKTSSAPGSQLEESQPVPVVETGADASPFEIDEVEALPEQVEGVLDLHEGASDFVPVTNLQLRTTDDAAHDEQAHDPS
jgi:hypothetical protein